MDDGIDGLVRPLCRLGWLGEKAVEAAGEVALEAAERFGLGLAFGELAFEVGAGVGVVCGRG